MRSQKPPPSSPHIVWPVHLAAHAKSELSLREYGRVHGRKADTINNKHYRVRAASAREPLLLPVTIKAAAPCELAFADGSVLSFPASLSAETLRAWVTVPGSR